MTSPKASLITTSTLILISVLVIACASDIYRLPHNVRPVRYVLTMEPDLEPGLSPVPYEGSVVIELKVLETTRNITLHNRYIEIDKSSIEVSGSSGEHIKVSDTSEDEYKEIYIIHLESDLLQGQSYNLTIGKFNSTLGYGKVGFYFAKYRNEQNVERRLAVTDFEPTDARQAFPCFDEPGIKAKFVINLIRRAEHNSVSNQELESTTDLGDGRYQDTFKETPDMSAYVVAFVISDLKPTKKVERHRILGRSDDVERGSLDYALGISVKTLKELEDYTGIKFPMDKMEQVAVPDIYFKDDAMENYGLVIYGESHLLCTSASAVKDLKRCTTYISHEFAHQWFGNLVTPEWWDYTWLSESFAAYFQYYIANIVQPSWRLMDLFIIDNLQYGLESEESKATDSLNCKIQMSGQFPPLNILYAKGSSIIRMMEHALTADVFRKGIQNYLQDRQFKSAVPSDLYNALQKSVDEAQVHDLLGNLKVADIMKSWDSNTNFPVVTVTRDYTTGSLSFDQDKFNDLLYTDPNEGGYKKDLIWTIPINYIFQSNNQDDFLNTTADYWLKEENTTLNKNFPTDGWLIVNKQQTGYYRVNYDKENWERIISFMNSENFKKIHVINRAQLIDDAFNLATYGHIPFDIPLRLCDYLVQEKDYIPFAAFYNGIGRMNIYYTWGKPIQYFENYTLKNAIEPEQSQEEIFKQYVTTTLSGILGYLGFEEKENDTFLDKANRAELIKILCNIGYPECSKFAAEKLAQFTQTKSLNMQPDLEKTILCVAMQKATEEEFDALHQFYNVSTDIHQRWRLRDGLSCSTFAYEKLDY